MPRTETDYDGLESAEKYFVTELQREVERRRRQWEAFHRWEAEQPPEERTPVEIVADLGTIWEWLPAEERSRDH